MCGIFGLWARESTLPSADTVKSACSELRLRGPDDEGYVLGDTDSGMVRSYGGADTDPRLSLPTLEDTSAGDLVLAHRRLSILDPSPAGHQPMSTSDGTVWIIHNGEIYNYIELREELGRHGNRFTTGTDTEVILAAYRTWGLGCLPRLGGMFAFALWDAPAGRLVLARDVFGIKPLYYTSGPARFAFASRIRALLRIPAVSRRVQAARLRDYLCRGRSDHDGQTFFADVRQVPAAHALELSLRDGSEPRLYRYWEPDLTPRRDLTFAQAAQRVRDLFLDSVRLHLRSDVAVGSALSGGIDSSAIVAAVRHHLGAGGDLRTFSYTASGPLNEERWAELASRNSGAHLQKVALSPDDLVAQFRCLAEAQEEPFLGPSLYAQYRVFEAAHHSGIKVMLDGQGADELLAGYVPYLMAKLVTLLRRGKLAPASRLLRAIPHVPGGGSMAACLRALAGQLIAPLWRPSATTADPPWLDASYFRDSGIGTPRPEGKPRELRHVLLRSLTVTSLPALLRYEDRNSMAWSVESRVPFLGRDLVEFTLQLPCEYLITSDGTTKAVFRAAMRGLVPDAILDRRDKVGFATPEEDWLRAAASWVDDVLTGDTARRIPALRHCRMIEQWRQIRDGRRPYTSIIWRWLSVIEWSGAMDVSF